MSARLYAFPGTELPECEAEEPVVAEVVESFDDQRARVEEHIDAAVVNVGQASTETEWTHALQALVDIAVAATLNIADDG